MTEEQIDYCEFWVTANRIVRESKQHNYVGEQIQVNHKLNFKYLENKLQNYNDKDVIKFLKFGWPLNAINTDINTNVPPNQKGAREYPEELKKYVEAEIKLGSIIGPFKYNPFGKFSRVSPLDTREKRDTDEKRVILNLSYPFSGGSVNESISKESYVDGPMNLTYPTIDDLARIINKKGRYCKIFKRDLRKAYRFQKMCPGTIHLLGFCVEGNLYFDVALSMGSRSAAFCCQRTTNMITFIFGQEGFEEVNYLDDLGSAELEEIAWIAYNILGEILNSIGIEESTSKAQPPAHIATFLGVLFNTIEMTMSITPERLIEITSLITSWLSKKSATLNEVQQLLGKLNFICNTVRAGRIFVSRLINDMKEFPKNGRRRLSAEFKKDLSWWNTYLQDFDGITLIPDLKWCSPDKEISTDSCLSGCGGWLNGLFFHSEFPKDITSRKDISINELETLALIVGLKNGRSY